MTSGSLPLCRAALLAALALLLVGPEAVAQSNPSTLQMSCAQVRGLIAARGAIVLNTGPTTYERFVGGYGYCVLGETPQPAWAPTADTAQCPVGYRCAPRAFPSRN